MDWMYKANDKGVNSEDYLLGKEVDSAILDAQKEEQLEEQGSSATVDMANKIREDPLFAIKQKEANKRKALLENPIRLKQLQHMLQSQVGAKSKKSKKKEKKSKREKRQKKSRQESSESSEDSDDDLDAKLMEKLKSQALKGRESEVQAALKDSQYGLIGGKSKAKSDSRRRDGSDDDRNEDTPLQRTGQGEDRDRQRQESHTDRQRDDYRKRRYIDEDRSGRRNDDGERRRERGEDRSRDRGEERSRERGVERSRDRGDERSRDRGEDRSRERGKVRSYQRQSERSRSRSPARKEKKSASQLSEAELEQRRKEMMNNAVWRDEQRKSRVEQYKIEAAKEDEMERKKSRKADFFNPLKVSSQSTVEDRIKRNIHNIQRTKADLDKNFAKR